MEAYGRHHPELVENDGPDAVLITSRGNSKDYRMLLRGVRKVRPAMPIAFLTTKVVSKLCAVIQVFRKGMQEALSKRYRGGNSPSTGLLGIYVLSQMCKRISVFGFSLEECRSAGCSRNYHYFHNFIDSEWLRAHPSHSFRLEGLLILSLHLEGTVCVYPPPLDLPCGRGLSADYDLLAPDGDGGGGSDGGEGEAPGGAGPAEAPA